MLLKSLANLKPALKETTVDVPELEDEGQVVVREMNGRRMANYQQAMKDKPGFPLEHLIIACCVDEDGNQIAHHDQVVAVSEVLPLNVIHRLFDACKEVNGALFEDIEPKKDSSESQDTSS